MTNRYGRREEHITLYGRKMRIQLIREHCDVDEWQIVGDSPFKGEKVMLGKTWGPK